MGIYIGVANYTKKQYLYNLQSVKLPGIMGSNHYLPRLLFLKMYHEWSGDNVSVIDDLSREEWPWQDSPEWEDVTLSSLKDFRYWQDDEEYKNAVKEFEDKLERIGRYNECESLR